MKLYLTLDNEKGNKIERLIDISPYRGVSGVYGIIDDMLDSMEKVEQENITPDKVDLAADDPAFRKQPLLDSNDPF